MVLGLIAANFLAVLGAAGLGDSGALMAASLLAGATACATRWTPTILRRLIT